MRSELKWNSEQGRGKARVNVREKYDWVCGSEGFKKVQESLTYEWELAY